LLRHRPAEHWWLRLLLLPAAVIAAAIGLNLIPWSAGWPFGGGLGGFAGKLLIGSGSIRGLANLTRAPAWVLQAIGLIIALPLYHLALGISWRRYRQAGQQLAAASGGVGRGAGWLLALLRKRRPEAAAEYRAERYEQERPRRMEPRLQEQRLDEGGAAS